MCVWGGLCTRVFFILEKLLLGYEVMSENVLMAVSNDMSIYMIEGMHFTKSVLIGLGMCKNSNNLYCFQCINYLLLSFTYI